MPAVRKIRRFIQRSPARFAPQDATPLDSPTPAKEAIPTTQRLVSLDAFRGVVMAFTIVVNNNGSERDAYAQLRHSHWHGWTLTDTVFPSFVWIVGVAIMLSLGNRPTAGVPRSRLLLTAPRPAAVMFVLGLAVYAFPHFNPSTQRILAVLQRIAICYLAASAIYLGAACAGRSRGWQGCWPRTGR